MSQEGVVMHDGEAIEIVSCLVKWITELYLVERAKVLKVIGLACCRVVLLPNKIKDRMA